MKRLLPMGFLLCSMVISHDAMSWSSGYNKTSSKDTPMTITKTTAITQNSEQALGQDDIKGVMEYILRQKKEMSSMPMKDDMVIKNEYVLFKSGDLHMRDGSMLHRDGFLQLSQVSHDFKIYDKNSNEIPKTDSRYLGLVKAFDEVKKKYKDNETIINKTLMAVETKTVTNRKINTPAKNPNAHGELDKKAKIDDSNDMNSNTPKNPKTDNKGSDMLHPAANPNANGEMNRHDKIDGMTDNTAKNPNAHGELDKKEKIDDSNDMNSNTPKNPKTDNKGSDMLHPATNPNAHGELDNKLKIEGGMAGGKIEDKKSVGVEEQIKSEIEKEIKNAVSAQ